MGFIYGSLNVMMVVLTFFFIPELKGRSLEEVDQLFASGVALRRFGQVETRTAEEVYEDEMVRKAALERRGGRVAGGVKVGGDG